MQSESGTRCRLNRRGDLTIVAMSLLIPLLGVYCLVWRNFPTFGFGSNGEMEV